MPKKLLRPLMLLLVTGVLRLQAQEDVPPVTLQFSPPMSEVKPDPLLVLAREHLEQGRGREAKKLAKQFLDKNENSPEGWALLGDIYAARGSDGKAKRRYKKALKFDPHYGPAYVGLGRLFEKKGRLDEAANEYRAAALVSPNDPVVQQALDRVAAPEK